MTEPQPGSDSTYATGQHSPDPDATAKVEAAFGNGTVSVPCGAVKKTEFARSNFTHDEIVVCMLLPHVCRGTFLTFCPCSRR